MSENPATTPFELATEAKLKARMNSIYYRLKIEKVTCWDTGLRLTSAGLASGGVITAVKSVNCEWLTMGVGVVAGLIGVASLVLHLPAQAKAAAAMLPQYVDLHGRLRTLVQQGDTLDEDELKSALGALNQLEVVEAKEILTSDRKLLDKAWQQTNEENDLDSET
jgi:hypothetical protein